MVVTEREAIIHLKRITVKSPQKLKSHKQLFQLLQIFPGTKKNNFSFPEPGGSVPAPRLKTQFMYTLIEDKKGDKYIIEGNKSNADTFSIKRFICQVQEQETEEETMAVANLLLNLLNSINKTQDKL